MKSRMLGLLIAAGSLAVASAAEAADCVGSGARSAWGQSMNATFAVTEEGCTYGFAFDGVASSSKILKAPKHGTARMINPTTVEYKPKRGYRGGDSFVIQATGRGMTSSGTSNITLNAVVR